VEVSRLAQISYRRLRLFSRQNPNAKFGLIFSFAAFTPLREIFFFLLLFRRARVLAVGFAVSPRDRHSESEMYDQCEQDHDHQVEQFSFVYHNHLPR
jgi:hypothetical protein